MFTILQIDNCKGMLPKRPRQHFIFSEGFFIRKTKRGLKSLLHSIRPSIITTHTHTHHRVPSFCLYFCTQLLYKIAFYFGLMNNEATWSNTTNPTTQSDPTMESSERHQCRMHGMKNIHSMSSSYCNMCVPYLQRCVPLV